MNTIKCIKRFLKKFDVFGLNFSFIYRQEDKYQTSLRGIFFIAFCVVVAVVGIYYFIPFIKRKNFSIVYYSMNLQGAEKLILWNQEGLLELGLSVQ